MPLSLKYTGDPKYKEIAEATRQAHAYLQDPALITVISGHEGPFDDSTPDNLKPEAVAGYFQEDFALTVIDYEDPKRRTTIGGRFQSSKPNVLQINTLALPKRDACEFATVLIHEGTHALSYRIKKRTDDKVSFSHHPNGRAGNTNTAPYWIQTQADDSMCDKALRTLELLEIEVEDDAKAE